ncbi:hypothetical protein CC79DRAFT_1365534 [Sarocladium strictum]
MNQGIAPDANLASAQVRQGLLSTGPGSVSVGGITYNNFAESPFPGQIRSLRPSLTFDRIQWRERAIEDAHDGTCSWVLETPQSEQWMAQAEWQHGLLWIKGHAGAGKSTIMKFAVEHARDAANQGLVLPHFFNARGIDPLEYSTEGMYRTLLVWLLDELPAKALEDLEKRYGRHTVGEWAIPELVRLLKATIKLLGHVPLTFYIDALDECDTEEVRMMLRVFRDMVKQGWSAGHQIRVCFASRPYPQITFPDAIFLDLSLQEQHIQDIVRYIDDHLYIGDSEQAQAIQSQLRRKAAGVFMWTVLVVSILNNEYDTGNLADLESRLDEIPAGLHDLFAYTLDRYPKDRDALLACFRLVLFWRVKLGAETIWWAVQLALGHKDEDIRRRVVKMRIADMERYVVDISKGLVEFRHQDAQLIHESVRDFVFRPNELQRLYGVQSRVEFEGQSHEALRDWLLAELIARNQQICDVVMDKGPTKLDYSDFEGWTDYPRAKYCPPLCFARQAVEQLWYHATMAQHTGRDQTTFLELLPGQIGPYFLTITRVDKEKLGAFRNVISILLFQDCGLLISETQLEAARRARKSGKPFGFTDCGSQILDQVLPEDCGSAVNALVDVYMRIEPRPSGLQELLQSHVRAVKKGAAGLRLRWDPCYNALLDLSEVDTTVANFFLLALTAPAELEPHLDTLVDLANSFLYRPRTLLARTLRLYVEHDIPNDAIQLYHYSTLRWAENWGSRRFPLGYDATFQEKEDLDAFLDLIDAIKGPRNGPDAT